MVCGMRWNGWRVQNEPEMEPPEVVPLRVRPEHHLLHLLHLQTNPGTKDAEDTQVS